MVNEINTELNNLQKLFEKIWFLLKKNPFVVSVKTVGYRLYINRKTFILSPFQAIVKRLSYYEFVLFVYIQ